MPTKRLTRNIQNRQIGGVAAGLAEYLSIDVVLIRLGFALLLLINGFGAVLYMVMWLLVPQEGATESSGEDTLRANLEDISGRTQALIRSLTDGNSNVLGVVLLSLGVLFLLNQLIPALSFGMIFAIALVAAGVILLVSQVSRR